MSRKGASILQSLRWKAKAELVWSLRRARLERSLKGQEVSVPKAVVSCLTSGREWPVRAREVKGIQAQTSLPTVKDRSGKGKGIMSCWIRPPPPSVSRPRVQPIRLILLVLGHEYPI